MPRQLAWDFEWEDILAAARQVPLPSAECRQLQEAALRVAYEAEDPRAIHWGDDGELMLFATRADLARVAGVSIPTVKRRLRRCTGCAALQVVRSSGGHAEMSATHFTIRLSRNAVEAAEAARREAIGDPGSNPVRTRIDPGSNRGQTASAETVRTSNARGRVDLIEDERSSSSINSIPEEARSGPESDAVSVEPPTAALGLMIPREAFREPEAAHRLWRRLSTRGILDASQRDEFFALCSHIAKRCTRHAAARIGNPGGYLRRLLEQGRDAWIDLPDEEDRRRGAKLAAVESQSSGTAEPTHHFAPAERGNRSADIVSGGESSDAEDHPREVDE